MKNPYSVERYLGLPSQQILELHLQLNPYFYINDKIFEGPLVQKIYKDNMKKSIGIIRSHNMNATLFMKDLFMSCGKEAKRQQRIFSLTKVNILA